MEEGDLVLCKVEKVTNTITFVSMPDGKEGTLVSSEIASGRIKLMRQYVVPNKQIVCKVLRVDGNHIHLSLRRVTSKEKKEVMQRFKQEQAVRVAFKQILGEDANQVENNILEEFENLNEFAANAKDDKSLIAQYIPKEKVEAFKKVLEKKRKKAELKQNIKIKCLENDGIKKIKDLFDLGNPNISISYISAGNFRLKLTVKDFKEGKHQMVELLENLEKKAKENNCEFHASEEK
jgi:translation initiation factor 2 alpha subunit (eIF-2alpha)